MSFCTAINCMDGRVQLPAIIFLMERFNVKYVDSITEAGPCQFFVGLGEPNMLESIMTRVDISVNHHGSGAIAIISHADCAGNPADDGTQQKQLKEAVQYLKEEYRHCTVVGLWIDLNWDVYEMY